MIEVAQEAQLGDIFWDLPTWVYYTARYDLGCTIYVANPTDAAKEYSLITHTYKNSVLQGEGVLQVYGFAWFTVEPGDFLTLRGTVSNNESDVTMVVSLFEKETQTSVDSISTILVTPVSAVMPPGWGYGTVGGVDMLSMMIMIMMMTMMMKMVSSTAETEEEKAERLEAKKLLSK